MEEKNTRNFRGVEEQYEEYQRQVQHQQQQQQSQQHYEQQVMVYGYYPQHHNMHLWNVAQQQQISAMHQHHHMYHGYQYPLQQMEGVPLPLPPGIPGLGGSTDPLEAVLGPFPCTRLRNLPYDASLEEILLLFQGLVVIDVILVGNGEAYVIFSNPMDFQMALQRDRQPIGRQFVEISAASRDQYYSAIAMQHMQEQEVGRHLESSVGSSGLGRDEGSGEDPQDTGMGSTIGGLWTGVGAGTPIPSGSVIQPLGSSPTFSEPMISSQHQASQQQQQQQIVSQQQLALPPGIVMSDRGASGSSRPSLHAPLQKRTGGGIQVGEHTGFLRMRGLPFSSTKEDIFHFFEGYNPVQESIVLTYRNDGRATGEAYVGFASPEDAKRAMELHRKMMGSRYIELFISNKDEQGRALARFGNR